MTTGVVPKVSQDPANVWAHIRKPLLIGLCYFLACEVAFFIGTLSDNIFAPFWPPNIVLFYVFLMIPPKQVWKYLVATYVAHVIAELGVGMNGPQLVVAYATNIGVALTNAYVLRYLVRRPPWLATLRNGAIYVVTTALFSPAIWAVGGAFVPILGGGSIADYTMYWTQWYASNAMTSLTLGPIAILVFCDSGRLRYWFTKRTLIEFVLTNICLALICKAAFYVGASGRIGGLGPTVLCFPLPLILWLAARFGGKGVAVCILVATVISTGQGIDGPSPFLTGNADANVFAIQTFLISLSAPLILLGAAVDETRHAAYVAREAKDRMTFAAASAKTGLWHMSRDGSNFWATEYCRAMFGFHRLVLVTWDDVMLRVNRDDRDIVASTIEDARQLGTEATCEFRVDAGGGVRWLTMSAHVELDEDQLPTSISGIFSDVTARKATEAEMEIQRRELSHLMRVSLMGELSGAIAHELSQPLTAIRANAEAAKRMLVKGASVDEVIEALDDIVMDDNRAGEVIQRMHRLLKKGEFKSEAVDLNDLMASTIKLVRNQLIDRRIKLQIEFQGNLPPLFGDAVQLQQVFINIVANAVEAMGATTVSRRALRIQTRLASDHVEVEIADQGLGISNEHQKRVFEPFFTTKEHGLGLGLALCATIVKSHGGRIQIENNGSGTTAVVSLPAGLPSELAEAV